MAAWACWASHIDCRPRAGADLKHVAVAVVVVRDHVEHVDARRRACRERSRQRPLASRICNVALDQALAEMAGAHAIGGKLLAGEMHQPDVARELALPREVQEDRGGQHQRGRGRMVVVGAGGRQPRPAAPVRVAEAVFHVGRVVMVGHDDGAAAVAAGDDHDQVAFVGLVVLVLQPAARPGKVEVGLPAEGQFADQRAAGHSRRLDDPPVVLQQIIAQRLQVAVVVRQLRLRGRVADAVGVVFVRRNVPRPAGRWSANRSPRSVAGPCGRR